MSAQVLGISVDSKHTLKAWADSLEGITYPLLSDFYPHGHIARMYGVFRAGDGYSERAIFVIDKSMKIRYVDVHDIDLQPDNDVLFNVLAELEPGGQSLLQAAPNIEVAPATNIPEADIVMYCTPWCPACRRARAFLKENGVQFQEIDITRDRTSAKLVRGWANGNETTPTFNIKGTIIVDFDKNRIAKLLGIA